MTPPLATRSMSASPSRSAANLGLLFAMWHRELLRLRREPARWIGIAAQPLLFWLILGSGFAPSFQLSGAPQVTYTGFFFPGTLVMVVLFTAIFATITVIEDRTSGFLQGVLVAPGARGAMVLGKVLGITTTVAIQSALFLALLPLAGLQFGQVVWLALVPGVVLTSVMLASIGMLMAWRLPTSQSYHAIMSVVLLPMWVVSGALFPPGGGTLEVIMMLNPLAHSVNVVRGAMLPELREGLWTELGVLLALAMVALGLATWACQRAGGRPA